MLTDAFLTAKGIFFPFAIIIPIWYLTSYLTSPLRGFPGPFFAGLTNLWRMLYVHRGNYHKEIYRLHEKYGPVVRIGPNVLSLDYPELIPTIYDTKGNYRKTEFYHPSSAIIDGQVTYNLFSESNPNDHKRKKKPIGKYYNSTDVLSFESHIDEIVSLLCQRLEKHFMGVEKTCDLDRWLLFYTWDVIGNVTFSQPLGYLNKGCDFDNTIKTSKTAMRYFSLVAQSPWLDYLFDKNPVCRIGPPSFGEITKFSIQKLTDRLEKRGANRGLEKSDFLDKFIEAKKKYPETVDDTQIISYLMNNMIAGADTTAITLTAILYFSLKNREVWKRLQDEIPVQPSTSRIFSYSDIKSFSYLGAVVNESMRLHPAAAMPLERYVSETGLTLPNGQYAPPGCIIGMDPYTIGRNQSVWRDPEVFLPERWLPDAHELENHYQERFQSMKNFVLTFGAGSRTCIGKNLAHVEMLKVVATLVSRFDITLVRPDDDWTTHNSFFLYQDGVRVAFCPRQE